MKTADRIIISIFLTIAVVIGSTSTTIASDQMGQSSAQALVQPFYDYLSGKASSDTTFENMADEWRSFSSDSTFRSVDETIAAIDGLRASVVPDLVWEIHDVIYNDGYIVVRGAGRGTPVANFFRDTGVWKRIQHHVYRYSQDSRRQSSKYLAC
ncbi:MAG: hypothetical protein AB8B97_18500 [Granulosicoccus sp.]